MKNTVRCVDGPHGGNDVGLDVWRGNFSVEILGAPYKDIAHYEIGLGGKNATFVRLELDPQRPITPKLFRFEIEVDTPDGYHTNRVWIDCDSLLQIDPSTVMADGLKIEVGGIISIKSTTQKT